MNTSITTKDLSNVTVFDPTSTQDQRIFDARRERCFKGTAKVGGDSFNLIILVQLLYRYVSPKWTYFLGTELSSGTMSRSM